jgi:hypothetical protein
MSIFAGFEGKHLLYIIVAVLIIALLFLFGMPFFFSELKEMKRTESDQINKLHSRRYVVPITKGVCSLTKSRQVINTYNKRNSTMFVDLVPSINLTGGAQYSYSFWLRKATGSSDQLQNKIIFYRGNEIIKCDKTMRKNNNDNECKDDENSKIGHIYDENGFTPEEYEKYQGIDRTIGIQKTNLSEDKNDGSQRFVKAPLVRFGDFDKTKNNTYLVVEFNSLRNPHLKVELDGEIFSMLKSTSSKPKYNLITISFQDSFDFGGVERGIKVEVFIDDALVKTKIFEDNALKINKGPIVLFPPLPPGKNTDEIDADIVDLTYYNFAVSTLDVDNIYKKGFRDITCQLPDSWSNSNNSKYNYGKINLYNETRQLGPSTS